MFKSLLVTLGLSVFSVTAMANTKNAENDANEAFDVSTIQTNGWFVGIGQVNFDQKTAFNEGVDSGATTLHVAYEGQDGHFIYNAGMGIIMYDDNNGFSQQVENNYGNRSTASSDATAISLFGELGYSFILKPQAAHFDLTAGVEQYFASERSISNCSNCYSEDIDLNAGFYIKPKIKFINANGFTFSISYQHFAAGDAENSFSLNFGMTYNLF